MMSPTLALLLVSSLQAAPAPASSEAVVLLTRRIDLPRLTAGEIVQAVGAAVEAEKVATMPSAAAGDRLRAAKLGESDACSGKKDCVLGLGRALGVAVVVSVQVGSVASSAAPVAVHLEALKVADGSVLAVLDAEVQRDMLKAVAGLPDFARRLREALAPPVVATTTPPVTRPPEAKPSDKPHEVVAIAPPPPPMLPPPDKGVPPEALGTSGEAQPKSHTAGYAMVGVAAVTAAGAVACLVAGMVLKPSVEGTQIDMTRAQADHRVKTINILMTTSLVAGIVAAGAGTTAAIVW